MRTLTKHEIKQMYRDGESPVDILRAATQTGIEYPDAEWLVSSTLRLDEDEREEMRANYDEQC